MAFMSQVQQQPAPAAAAGPLTPSPAAASDAESGLLGQADSMSGGGASGGSAGIQTKVYILAGCAALNSCNLGFDIGVNTGVAPTLQQGMNLTDERLEMFMGALNLFAIAGASLASVISDPLGRRGAFAVAAVGFIVGVLLEASASSYSMLMFGRIFVGLGVGFGLAIDPVRLLLLATFSSRGFVCGFSLFLPIKFPSGLFFFHFLCRFLKLKKIKTCGPAIWAGLHR